MELPFSIEQIKSLIPHRAPFLLVDRILAYTPGESIVGLKNISISEPALAGHFPDLPIFPGVMQIEALAQTSAVFGRIEQPQLHGTLLTEVREARFRRQVVPGDQLTLKVKLEKKKLHFFWFYCEALVGDQVATTVSISAKLG